MRPDIILWVAILAPFLFSSDQGDPDYACPDCQSRGTRGSICEHPEPMGDKYRLPLWQSDPGDECDCEDCR